LGIAGFAIHLLIIFLTKTLAHPPVLIASAGDSLPGRNFNTVQLRPLL
jgi:hypothetical protein